MTQYLELEDAVRTIGQLGFHVRDIGLLDSALARPSASMFGTDAYPNLATKAAGLLESLARNHPLFDGNKRTAWILMVQFVWLNGYQHDFDADTAFDHVIGVASGAIDLEAAAAALAAHLIPR